MTTALQQGERVEQRVDRHRVIFEGSGRPEFDITDGELVKRLQAGDEVAAGTRVRIAHHEDGRNWFEVVRVVEVTAPAAA